MSGAVLRPFDRKAADRLAKVAGLLGSDQAGERASAAMQASRLLRERGWSWRNLVERAVRADDAGHAATDEPPPLPPRNLARWAMRSGAAWSAWELGFLSSLAAGYGAITPRQRDALTRLARRAALYQAARAEAEG